MSLQALSDYTVYSRYARYLPAEKRRETWSEIVDRVFAMHEKKYDHALQTDVTFRERFYFTKDMVKKKRVLGSQRALQFGGESIFKHSAKMFNCSFSYIDRPDFFSECMYLLLCGCGVGFSVQRKHIDNLPSIVPRDKGRYVFKPEDSIEGWADCVKALFYSYFQGIADNPYAGKNIEFDMSNIRPEGALIAGQFKAPGPGGLLKSLNKARDVIEARINKGENRLHPIDAYDCIMHCSDAVLSGGVRRSATICLFSKDDGEMMNAKTGDWFLTNPQRGRSNNSALLVRDSITKEEFARLMKSTREFGEPGFIFADNEDVGFNPCCEILLYPKASNGRTGFQMCNLSEINGKYCTSEENFLNCCVAASFIGTLQAGYADFKYLSKESQMVTEREALLGCSITGIMDNPDVLLNPKILKAGANLVKTVNKATAKAIGINPSARTTCVKPAGSTSCVLSTASGIHPHHARRYIRRVQANKNEFPVQYFKKHNPDAVEKSVWSANETDEVISFLCEVPAGAIVKNNMKAVDLLEAVKIVQQNWVEYGTDTDLCVISSSRHNVSNTITVKEDEWDDVEKYIYTNRKYFAGISLLPASGDLDYPQAPFTSVLDYSEITDKYGPGSILASGLIVDGLSVFNDNLWAACDAVNGVGEKTIQHDPTPKPIKPPRKKFKTEKEYTSALLDYSINLNLFYQNQGLVVITNQKIDWIRRAKQFADRYFDGSLRQMCHCLKHVYVYKQWLDLQRTYRNIDWSTVVEETETYVDAKTLSAAACTGNKCELV